MNPAPAPELREVDAGEPRNAPAEAMHGAQHAGRAARASQVGGRFRVELDGGELLLARRLVVTTGLVDELLRHTGPQLDAEQAATLVAWGVEVIDGGA